MPRILNETRDTALPDARAVGESLWLDSVEVERATGWSWKPQGMCRGDACMPIPRGHEPALTDGDRLDVAAFWRWAGWPVVRDDASEIWVLGEGAGTRTEALESGAAPDFELPDLDGRPHRLSDYRGRRVFLGTWASW